MIGYRGWSIDPAGRLGSLVMDGGWYAGVNEAGCRYPSWLGYDSRTRAHSDQAPGCPSPNCLCGLWMRSSCTDALHYVHGLIRGSRWKVVGAIEAWGTIIEHEQGLRCQYATILGLLMPWAATSGMKDAVRKASLAYDVPVFETAPALTIHANSQSKRLRVADEVTRPPDTPTNPYLKDLNT